MDSPAPTVYRPRRFGGFVILAAWAATLLYLGYEFATWKGSCVPHVARFSGPVARVAFFGAGAEYGVQVAWESPPATETRPTERVDVPDGFMENAQLVVTGDENGPRTSKLSDLDRGWIGDPANSVEGHTPHGRSSYLGKVFLPNRPSAVEVTVPPGWKSPYPTHLIVERLHEPGFGVLKTALQLLAMTATFWAAVAYAGLWVLRWAFAHRRRGALPPDAQ